MDKKLVLLLYGGGGAEDEISKISMKHISSLFENDSEYTMKEIYVGKDFSYEDLTSYNAYSIIPCFHGTPGETGEIQPILEKLGLNYIGCKEQASRDCFDKNFTKQKLEEVGISTTPFIHIESMDQQSTVESFFDTHQDIFVKANAQGSSVGCYPVHSKEEIRDAIEKAFQYSDTVLIEKYLHPRELEVSAYEMGGELHISHPSEILKGDKFYSYEEKYSDDSKTTTEIKAKNVTEEIKDKIQEFSRLAFKTMNLRHLSRIDFFLDGENLYLNEINTFPGLTPISMFPKMLESNGHSFKAFLVESIENSVN